MRHIQINLKSKYEGFGHFSISLFRRQKLLYQHNNNCRIGLVLWLQENNAYDDVHYLTEATTAASLFAGINSQQTLELIKKCSNIESVFELGGRMIYSIALPNHKFARPGKSVWRTIDDAQAALEQNPNMLLWVLDADWEQDTKPVENAVWHELQISCIMREYSEEQCLDT